MCLSGASSNPGVTVDQARSEMKTIDSATRKGVFRHEQGRNDRVRRLLENLIGKYRTNLGLLLGAWGGVADRVREYGESFCARGAARGAEFASSRPVGASRDKIVKQL